MQDLGYELPRIPIPRTRVNSTCSTTLLLVLPTTALLSTGKRNLFEKGNGPLAVLQERTQISRYRSARTGAPHCGDPYPPAVCIRTPPTLMSEAGIVCTTGSRPRCHRSAHEYSS